MTRAPLGSIVCRKNSGVCGSEVASSMVFTMRHSDISVRRWRHLLDDIHWKTPSCAGFDQHLNTRRKPAQNTEPDSSCGGTR